MNKYDGWRVELGGVVNGYFSRKNYLFVGEKDYDELKQEFVDLCHNRDVYQCAYAYKNDDYDHCEMIADPYLDFDTEDIEDPAEWEELTREVKYVLNYIESSMGIPPEELRVYFSGSKGFHVIIPHELIGLAPSTVLNQSLRYFALGLSYVLNGRKVRKNCIDTGIYDRKRLIRIPGTINSKSGLYKIPVSIDQLYNFCYNDVREAARAPREDPAASLTYRSVAREGFLEIVELGKRYEAESTGRKYRRRINKEARTDKKLLPCAEKLLKEGAERGSRNHSCYALASSLLQAGYEKEEMEEVIVKWNDDLEEPLPGSEVEATIKSAEKNFDNGMMVGCGKYRELDLCVTTCSLIE